jgi:hypothetical protein
VWTYYREDHHASQIDLLKARVAEQEKELTSETKKVADLREEVILCFIFDAFPAVTFMR